MRVSYRHHHRYIPVLSHWLYWLILVLLMAPILPVQSSAAVQPASTPLSSTEITPNQLTQQENLLSFEPNEGQFDPAVRFKVDAMGGTLFFTSNEIVLSLPSASAAEPDQSLDQTPRIIEDAQGNLIKAPAETLPETSPERLSPSSTLKVAPHTVVRLRFEGAHTDPQVTGVDELRGKLNYFLGNDPEQWHTDIPLYSGILYQNLYPGIDVQFDSLQGEMKGTYFVAAGADPNQIRWRYQGTENVEIDTQTNNLIVTLPQVDAATDPQPAPSSNLDKPSVNMLTEHAPIAWQDINGKRVAVTVQYSITDDNSIGFTLGAYDPAYSLVIDPTLSYSTFIGGSNSEISKDIAVDSAGNAYITGWTQSVNFPIDGDIVPPTPSNRSFPLVFVTKLNADGTSLIYSAFLGGSSNDFGNSIGVDNESNVYIAGYTSSADFPVINALDDVYGSDNTDGVKDAFVTKLAPDGNRLEYSTYLGGAGTEEDTYLTVDPIGNTYVTGQTGSNASSGFPITSNAYDQTRSSWDAYVVKLTSTGDHEYGTYLGGTGTEHGRGIVVDSMGNMYIVGDTDSTVFPDVNGKQPVNAGENDVFVAKLNASGNAREFITYLGGNEQDYAKSIAIRELTSGSAEVYVAGETFSSLFPTTIDAYDTSFNGDNTDGFVTKLSSDGQSWDYSTFLGSEFKDSVNGIAVDSNGNAYVTGEIFTLSRTTTFPLKDPVLPYFGGNEEAFVAQFNGDGSDLNYSSFVGGSSSDVGYSITLDSDNNAYITGITTATGYPSSDLPTTPGAYNRVASLIDAFVVKIGPLAVLSRPTPRVQQALNWEVRYNVSDDDGLVVENPTLGTRLLAQQISLPYIALETSAFAEQRFELKPNGTGIGRSQLIGFWVQPERFGNENDRNRLVIQAYYRLDNFPNDSQSYLFITQRYEFHEAVGDDTLGPEPYPCEPSEEDLVTRLFGDFTCARWKPINTYHFTGRDGEMLTSITMPERLHFTPDGEPLRGNAMIHDCEDGETGTLVEPCLFTDVLSAATLVYAAPRLEDETVINNPSTSLPGIKLKNNTASLDREVIEDAIVDGGNVLWHSDPNDLGNLDNAQPGTWDNLHLTRNAFVDLPVPMPPGCPECVHIHWRWAEYFDQDRLNNAKFGNGPPQIEGPPGQAGNVMIPQKPIPSNQDVKVALVKYNSGEEDPIDAWALANNEPLTQNDGTVVWYLATGKQPYDTFFAHGGFFSPLTEVEPIDLAITVSSSSSSSIPLGSNVTYDIDIVKNNPDRFAQTITLYAIWPETAKLRNVNIPGTCRSYNHTLICEVSGLLLDDPFTFTLEPTVAGPFDVSTYVSTPNLDTNFSDNRSDLTVTVASP